MLEHKFNFHPQTNSVAFSPKEKDNDWAIATRRRIIVATFVDRGMSRGQRGGTPMAVRLRFLERSRFKYILIYPYEAEWTPF
jgi:hypothetical protein